MDYSKRAIEGLLRKFGSPLCVFDEMRFRNNYCRLNTAMKSQYVKYQAAYSFKTNYTPYICRTAKDLGAYAEVVSGMEYAIAKKIGYEDRHIIFNGPEKGEEGIEAFLNGAIVNADSLDELLMFCQIAQENSDRSFGIGLRINLDVGQGFVSRFGMDEKDVKGAFEAVERIGNLKIAGLHCHISRCRFLEAWKKRTEIMLELSDRYFPDVPEYLDLGSGMFGSMAPEFASQFGEVPTYEDYAEITSGMVAEHYRGKKGPVLFTEPGTTLVNRFVDCIARVKFVKKVKDSYFAVLDASEHILGETCTLKKLPIRVIPCGETQTEYKSIDLTGYTCLEQDVLFSGFQGKMAKGDYIVFGNAGGYSNVLKPPFIRPACAMVVEKPDGSFQLIKAAETYDNVLQTYIF